MSQRGITRREVIRRSGGLLALPALVHPGSAAAEAAATPPASPEAAGGLRLGDEIYESIGVRPLVNARGTYTILSGSLMLPEVRAAMDAASRHYVHLDELAEGVGARLAELTGAEWGMVSCGCAAGLTLATAACVAGGNPDLHVRIPDLRGFAKDEVVIPKHSRNVYDAAVRAVGVRVIEVDTPEELAAALGPRTAMIYILAGPEADAGPLTTALVAERAKAAGVPVLVDAAAEILTLPNVHLEAGADLVAYSGGKCLRGPQTAGLLLGRESLVRAAWVHSAPHHGFARGLKVGKEEAMGMLMAVEMWHRRDHQAEWDRWSAWLEHIARRVTAVPGVTTSVLPPVGLSNRTPYLEVYWDAERLGVDGQSVVEQLFAGAPRVALVRARGGDGLTGVRINPYMLSPGDERTVADALHGVLAAPQRAATPATEAAPAADLSGSWDVRIEYLAGTSTHTLHLRQAGGALLGVHEGDFVSRDLEGRVDGDSVRMRSRHTEDKGDSLSFSFEGRIRGETLEGELDMGEYLAARWSARRHAGRDGRRT